MYEESDPPLVYINILLFDAQETDIRIVRHIGHGDHRHQPGEEGEGQQQEPVNYIGAAEYLSYF